jgi:hypothetical protein
MLCLKLAEYNNICTVDQCTFVKFGLMCKKKSGMLHALACTALRNAPILTTTRYRR